MKFYAILLLPFFVIGCNRPGDGRESASDKREWSILQALVASNKDPKTEIRIQKEDEYFVICVPRLEDRKPIWIMANAKSAPFYKQMPSGLFILSKAELEQIRKEANPTSTVYEVLQSHIQE